jgi:hypothetical protein
MQHQCNQCHKPYVVPEFHNNVQQFRIYLVMLGGQPQVTMVHTPGVYYSIDPATSACQGRVLAFIGDQRATKEPNPVCMPTTKTWEWYLGNAVTDFRAFKDHFAIEKNRGTLWAPGIGEGTLGAIQVPHLLAIPDVLVNLLCIQGPAIMPHDALMTVDGFILSSPHPMGPQ